MLYNIVYNMLYLRHYLTTVVRVFCVEWKSVELVEYYFFERVYDFCMCLFLILYMVGTNNRRR